MKRFILLLLVSKILENILLHDTYTHKEVYDIRMYKRENIEPSDQYIPVLRDLLNCDYRIGFWKKRRNYYRGHRMYRRKPRRKWEIFQQEKEDSEDDFNPPKKKTIR